MSDLNSDDPEKRPDLGLVTIDLDDLPPHTHAVLGAIWGLERDDVRTEKSRIGERIDLDLTRDQLTYRLKRLREEGAIYQDDYMEHHTARTEYRIADDEASIDSFDPDALRADARRCYGAGIVVDPEEIADPSVATMVALAGRVVDAEARLDRLEQEADFSDSTTGISKFV